MNGRVPMTIRRRLFRLAAGLAGLLLLAAPATARTADWQETLAAARGQTVHWYAWAGDEKINAYIAWVAGEMERRYGVDLQHVKISDTAEAVSQVIAEKAAGRDSGGAVDLVWINGENFAAMKQNGLLYGPFTGHLPNYALVDTGNKPTTTVDFTVPVDGLEAPWGMAQLVFMHDTARVEGTPGSIPELLEWARAHPGRFTYPAPPDFMGTTFLKQALIELAPDPAILQKPPRDGTFGPTTAPLWSWLEDITPYLWRQGRAYPQSWPAMRQLLNDGEIDVAMAFNPADASSSIAQGLLPGTVRSFVLDGGTIGNTHFVAIPYNAGHKEAAMVVANFLMSPAAQARKQNPEVWGDPTVLALDRLDPGDRALFENLPRGVATLAPDELGRTLLEPHPDWMTRIEEEWRRRRSN
jgi:putative thiamine transport system substrate-binding protein